MPQEPGTKKIISAKAMKVVERSVCGLLAVLGLGGGGVAVFETDNQAGTAALLTIGAFAALFCVVGSVPLRWSVGATTFDLSETVEAIVDVVSAQLSPDQLRAASAEMRVTAGLADQPDGITQRLADGFASASHFESMAHGRLQEVARSLEWRYRQQAVIRRARPDNRQDFRFEVDGLFETTAKHQIAVEMKVSTSTNLVFAAVRQLTALLEAGAVDGGIIAVNGPVPDKVAEYLDATDRKIIAVDLARIPVDLVPTLQALELRVANSRPDR